MMSFSILALAATIAIVFAMARARAARLGTATGRLHSTPLYHGLLAATGALLAGLAVVAVSSLLWATGNWAAAVVPAIFAAAAGLFLAARVSKAFQARAHFERMVLAALVLASAVAVLTTAGIFASVAFESWAFFGEISFTDFLFGTKWAPTGTPPSFGFLPLLTGTLLITAIAIVVAAPLGLLSAIYMAEYASPAMRGILKPILEMLAGIPTVVLGFFAALTAAPAIRNMGEALGLSVASESALAAGLVMGMMIVPLISSLSDDIINAVPQTLRDGSYAMGATKSETIKRVVLPAALPGIASAIMLAISRAIGETMIVVMAAGLAANLSINPLAAVSTITVQIATLLVGDQEFDSAKTLSAFALGLVLFFVTLALNYVALRVVQKYREQYD
jgi:phosphate transport system permease protein